MRIASLLVLAVSATTALAQPAEVLEAMQFYSQMLGVSCDHCHVGTNWNDPSKPPFAMTRKMIAMVRELNSGPLKTRGGVDCGSCHGGQKRPSRFPSSTLQQELGKWPVELPGTPQNVKFAMTINRVTLGAGCDHCHVPGDWTNESKPAFAASQEMARMFEIFPKYIDGKSFSTQCWMCHKGQVKPKRHRAVAA
jgi:hypothetical protein